MNNNNEQKSWRRSENVDEKVIPISSFSTYKKPKKKNQIRKV